MLKTLPLQLFTSVPAIHSPDAILCRHDDLIATLITFLNDPTIRSLKTAYSPCDRLITRLAHKGKPHALQLQHALTHQHVTTSEQSLLIWLLNGQQPILNGLPLHITPKLSQIKLYLALNPTQKRTLYQQIQQLINTSPALNHAKQTLFRLVKQPALSPPEEETLVSLVQQYPILVFTQYNGRKPPLHLAACYGGLALMKHLINAGSRVDSEDDLGLTPLHLACVWRHGNMVTYLIHDAGANVSRAVQSGFYEGSTPLHKATEKGYAAIVRILLDADADVNAIDAYGYTPLHWAAQESHLAIVQDLCQSGANTTKTLHYGDSRGDTALAIARKKGYQPICHYLETLSQQRHASPTKRSGDSVLGPAKKRSLVCRHDTRQRSYCHLLGFPVVQDVSVYWSQV